MCEILFRGKRFDGIWQTGYYFSKPILNRAFILLGEKQWEIDPSTVGRYTSLTDKNGVKIFEGDIIAGEGSRAKTDHFVIRWNAAICGFSAGERKRVWPNLNQATVSTYEVIGNILDNPDL